MAEIPTTTNQYFNTQCNAHSSASRTAASSCATPLNDGVPNPRNATATVHLSMKIFLRKFPSANVTSALSVNKTGVIGETPSVKLKARKIRIVRCVSTEPVVDGGNVPRENLGRQRQTI